jgi:predicted component of type VI protein secretion system
MNADDLGKMREMPGGSRPTADPAARLNVLLCAARFAQALRVIARDRVAAGVDRDLEGELNRWLARYVLVDPAAGSPEEQVRRPLLEGRLEAQAIDGQPNRVRLEVTLRPHYQLDPPPQAVRLPLGVYPRRPAE